MFAIRFSIIATLFLFSSLSTAVCAEEKAPLVIGETFTIESKILGETRRINVYATHPYGEAEVTPLPVLYMPDGGIAEDFLHVAGLVQVSVGNGTMRPFLLVGIENTQRRRDMTGPTENAEDRKIAPKVGESKAFREFIGKELMPKIRQRYRTTDETAIVGESLAGLFVIETFLLQPDMFDTYIAFDPSLWWNDQALVKAAGKHLALRYASNKRVYIATSEEKELAAIVERLLLEMKTRAPANLDWKYRPMPEETHGTIYHPAALKAFREMFKPLPAK